MRIFTGTYSPQEYHLSTTGDWLHPSWNACPSAAQDHNAFTTDRSSRFRLLEKAAHLSYPERRGEQDSKILELEKIDIAQAMVKGALGYATTDFNNILVGSLTSLRIFVRRIDLIMDTSVGKVRRGGEESSPFFPFLNAMGANEINRVLDRIETNQEYKALESLLKTKKECEDELRDLCSDLNKGLSISRDKLDSIASLSARLSEVMTKIEAQKNNIPF